jgi:hypothetical protein
MLRPKHVKVSKQLTQIGRSRCWCCALNGEQSHIADCLLFKNPVKCLDSTASNVSDIWWTGGDSEGRGRGLMGDISWNLLGGTEEKPWSISQRIRCSSRDLNWKLPTRTAIACANLFGFLNAWRGYSSFQNTGIRVSGTRPGPFVSQFQSIRNFCYRLGGGGPWTKCAQFKVFPLV